MIKLSVMYAFKPGARFDHAYYRDKHMPMVAARMGTHCVKYAIDRGLAGNTPDAPPAFVAVGHVYSESVESFNAGFLPHMKEILADIPNYTDIAPQTQISEVVVD